MANLRTASPDNVLTFRAPTGRTPQPKRRELPLGPALPATIARLREIAALSGDSLVTDGPVHPDHRLLDLCAAALHLMRQADQALDVTRFDPILGQAWTDAERAYYDARDQQRNAFAAQARQLLKRARYLKASTPAGVYAKALLVAGSVTGAVELARSLAAYLIDCPTLRQSLAWPDAQGEARP